MPDGLSPRTAGEAVSRPGVEGRESLWARWDLPRRWQGASSRVRSVSRSVVGYGLIPLAGGFFLARAVVLETLHPFGVAFVVALAASGHRGRSLAAAAGVLWAALSSPGGSPLDNPAAVLIFVWLFAALAGHWFRLSPWVTASGAMLGGATLRIVTAAFAGDSVLIAWTAAAVDLTAAWALLPVVRGLFRRRAPEGSGDGEYTGHFLLFASLLLVGTGGLQLLGHSVRGLSTLAFVLLAAAAGGVGGGAAAGTSLSVLTVLGDPGAQWEAVVYAAAGIGAGLGAGWAAAPRRRSGGRPRRGEGEPMHVRIGAMGGLLVAQLLLALPAPDAARLRAGFASAMLAGAVLVFVPEAWLQHWRRRLEALGFHPPGRRPGDAEAAAWRAGLTKVAGAFGQASATLAVEEPEEAAAADILATQRDFDGFVGDVREKVCRGCAREAVCWDTHEWQTYRDLLAFVAEAPREGGDGGGGSRGWRRLPSGLDRRCIQKKHFVRGVDKLLALVHDRARREQQRKRWEAPLQRKLDGLAGIIGKVAEEIDRLEGGAASGGPGRDRGADEKDIPPRFQLHTDSVHVPGDALVESGDYFEEVVLPGPRVAFIVCDGMGSGPRAAAESRAVGAMLRRFLEAGFDLRFCVETINAVMLLRASEESFVTVDVGVVDLRRGTLRMAKTGAAPTYIHRGGDVEMVRADSLPVGILPGVEVFEAERRLQLGDVVVMMSDGALELGASRGDKGEAVRRHLRRLTRPRPKQVVDSLFSRARHGVATGAGLPDDVTIAAGQLLPALIEPPL